MTKTKQVYLRKPLFEKSPTYAEIKTKQEEVESKIRTDKLIARSKNRHHK